MDTGIKTEWVKALRSGEYEQGVHHLLSSDGTMCCLGVLATIQGVPRRALANIAKSSLQQLCEAGLTIEEQKDLAKKNDCGWSFPAIAGYIEANL